MNHSELEAIRSQTLGPWNPSGRKHRENAAALLAELDRKTLLLERYGAQLEAVRRLATDLEYEGWEAQADRLRKIVGPK